MYHVCKWPLRKDLQHWIRRVVLHMDQHYKHLSLKAIDLRLWTLGLCDWKICKSSIVVDVHCSFINVDDCVGLACCTKYEI